MIKTSLPIIFVGYREITTLWIHRLSETTVEINLGQNLFFNWSPQAHILIMGRSWHFPFHGISSDLIVNNYSNIYFPLHSEDFSEILLGQDQRNIYCKYLMRALPSPHSMGSYYGNYLESDSSVRDCGLLSCQLSLSCYLLSQSTPAPLVL